MTKRTTDTVRQNKRPTNAETSKADAEEKQEKVYKNFQERIEALQAEILGELGEIDASDVHSLEMHNKLVNRYLNLYAMAEAVYRVKPTQGNAYVLSNFSNAIRELREDIEVSNERNNIGEFLNDNVIRPAFNQMNQQFIQATALFREGLHNFVDKTTANEIMQNCFSKNMLPFAKYLDTQREGVCTRIVENVES
jgi:hypothetical protein